MSQLEFSIARRQAFCELLITPDPPDLHRGFVMRLEGKPDRHRLLEHLAAAFVRAKLIEIQALQQSRETSH
jgi:hypothetical protein